MNTLSPVVTGKDDLPRVRNGKLNTDAEQRVPTGSGLCAQPNFSTASLKKGRQGCRAPVYELPGQPPRPAAFAPFVKGGLLACRRFWSPDIDVALQLTPGPRQSPISYCVEAHPLLMRGLLTT